MKRFLKGKHEEGSALLIVLGFLSFIIISAVAFSVYMRIERQASSNYRHAVVARQLLNSALYRAIDEIDSELRIDTINGTAQPRKFPNWTGRVKPSAVPNGEDNDQNARVLSLEALSFLPASLVNDVRRYAVTNADDSVTGVNMSEGKYSYLGAKWRSLSMPVLSIASGEDAYEEAVIGRYAYVCVNLSDMLNVNDCKATLRNASTNQIGIGYLFGAKYTGMSGAETTRGTDAAKTARNDFETQRNTYKCYATLQDFYACMANKNNGSDITFGSPYHYWLTDKTDKGFYYAKNHVLVTDGFSKAEPTAQGNAAINILDKTYENNLETAVEKIAGKLADIPTLAVDSSTEDHFKNLLMDYLDEDNTPCFKKGWGTSCLYRPTGEMVPMIYQIILDTIHTSFTPVITSEETGTAPNTSTKYKLKLATTGDNAYLYVQTIFPFKHWINKKVNGSSLVLDSSSYALDARAYLAVIKTSEAKGLTTQQRELMTLDATQCFELGQPSTSGSPMPTSENASDMVQSVSLSFPVPSSWSSVDLFSKGSDGSITPGFCQPGDTLRVAFVVFVGVKQNSTTFVDLVPGYFHPTQAADQDLDNMITEDSTGRTGIPDRLFFETTPITTPDVPTADDFDYSWEWTSLDTPDPRFNHKASNWIRGTETQAANAPTQVTKDILGQDGRDADIYMSASNVGKLYSIGEFGFLVRSFADAENTAQEVYLSQQTAVSSLEDYAHMFRTVRLYDHGTGTDQVHDKIYDYFTAEKEDGSSLGARVNPLSDIPRVLFAAIEQTPFDYWYAVNSSTLSSTEVEESSFNNFLEDSGNLSLDGNTTSWGNFRKQWYLALTNAVGVGKVNTAWDKNLSDVYGDDTYFKWYSSDLSRETVLGVNTGHELDEIDRKMLFSFSRDSFCDRQQLFLYILRAEATSPSLGKNAKSLAGGRAVALVWRDPYPKGYVKSGDTWDEKGNKTWYSRSNGTSTRTFRRVSPWYQVNKGQYDDEMDPVSNTDDLATRLDGYHDFRILFFKQLDN